MRKTLIILILVTSALSILVGASFINAYAADQTDQEKFIYFLPVIFQPPVDTTFLPDDWLARLNLYRAASGLPSVEEDNAYSSDLAKHVNYMLLNTLEEGLVHGEDPNRPGYTPEGAQAAAESNLWFNWYIDTQISPGTAIDVWLGSMHHRFGMLKPDLVYTGFAIGCDSEYCGTGLNVLRGQQPGTNEKPDGVFYPGKNQLGVQPDIIISWQFEWHPTVILKSASLHNSKGVAIPVITQTPEPDDYFNMVSLKPTKPLSKGEIYTVEIHVILGERELIRIWNFTTRY